MNNKELAIVDVETTGSRSSHDRIIEIGIVRFLNGEITETYSSLVDPGRPVSQFISMLTGIKNEELMGAPTFYDISVDVQRLLRNAVFVAHNVRFDYGFVRNEFLRLGIDFETERLCTVKFSRELYPEYRRHSLTELIDRFDFSCESRHRALDDALVVAEFLSLIQKKQSPQKIDQAYRSLLQDVPSSFHHNFSPAVEFSL